MGRRKWSLPFRGRLPCGSAALTAWLGFGPRGQAGSMDGCCLQAARLALAQDGSPRPAVQGSDPGNLLQPLYSGIKSARKHIQAG